MAENKFQGLANMTTRQKAIAGVVVVIVLFLGWQVFGMFGGSSKPSQSTTQPVMQATRTGGAMTPTFPGGPPGMPQMPGSPQKASLIKEQPLTEREKQLMQLQQETQAKYVAALNELQMLKLALEIAQTNKSITAAKLDTVKNQKGIVDLLSEPGSSTPLYPQGLMGTPGGQPVVQGTPQSAAVSLIQSEVNYTVVSVSQVQRRWSAVLAARGSLYSVTVGDVLPLDGSTVLAIDRSGVILKKDGEQKKISLVPII